MPGPSSLRVVKRANTRIYWAIGVAGVLVALAVLSGQGAQERQLRQAEASPIYVRSHTKERMPEPKQPEPVVPFTPVQAATQAIAPQPAPPPRPMPQPAPKVVQPKPAPVKKERKSHVLVEEERLAENTKDVVNDFTLKSKVQPLLSPYTVLAGDMIPAVLLTGIMSDLPGGIRAQVSENVYDTVTKGILLIPQGSTVLGAYNHDTVEGQKRVLVVWNRLIFPNGSSLSLGEMDGVDVAGYSGFSDKVNTHFWETFGRALALSVISAGTGIAQSGTSGRRFSDPYNSPADIATGELGRELGRTSNEVIRRGINRAPTIEIRQGYLCNVEVKKDIVLPGPYEGQ